MKKFIITTTIEEEIEANDEEEAYQMFFEAIENEPQQTITTYLSDHLKIEEAEALDNPNDEKLDKLIDEVLCLEQKDGKYITLWGKKTKEGLKATIKNVLNLK